MILISRILRMTYSGNQQRHTIFPLPGALSGHWLNRRQIFCLAGLIEKLGDEHLWLQDLDPTVP